MEAEHLLYRPFPSRTPYWLECLDNLGSDLCFCGAGDLVISQKKGSGSPSKPPHLSPQV